MIVTVTPNPALDRTLTVPEILFDTMVRASNSRLDLDGKGVNVSKALQVFGATTVIMGFAGGAAGALLAQGLAVLGLTTNFTPVAGETRSNTIIIDATANRYVKANESGPTVTPDEVAALFAQVAERVQPADLWIMAGSLPPGAPVDLYARLVELVQARGARVLLDTSGQPLLLGCRAAPFLVKPNSDEIQDLIGHPVTTDDDARRAVSQILDLGVQMVALSLGAAGLLLASQDGSVRAKPPKVQARNPVGAGDALLAGITWGLEQGLPLEELARWGVASGTAAAMGDGTGPPPRAQVEALYRQVQVDD